MANAGQFRAFSRMFKSVVRNRLCRYRLNRSRADSALWIDLTVGVTTYQPRYEEWLIPLLRNGLPNSLDRHWVVAINGIRDTAAQGAYLQRFEQEWRGTPRLTCIAHPTAVGIAQLWNEIVQASPTRFVLILNDDLTLEPCFWSWLATVGGCERGLTKINGIWSHFIVDRRLLERIGWFDETFCEIGFEDFDYEGRMWVEGIWPTVATCPFIRHEWLKSEETSFEGERIWDKYSMVNRCRFGEKWAVSDGRGEGLYLPQIDKSIQPSAESLDFRPPARRLEAGAGGAGFRWIDMLS